MKLGEDYLKDLQEDVIFRTPGMRPDLPELTAAVDQGSQLTSEMEVFSKVCPCPMIAVTGSDGKTTTTTIIAGLLRKAGKTVHLGGNIGNPLLAEAGSMAPEDIAVLELSSFQLMTMDVSPHIAVVTNLAPNHLDVHKDLQEYISAKENIFTHQSAAGYCHFSMQITPSPRRNPVVQWGRSGSFPGSGSWRRAYSSAATRSFPAAAVRSGRS